MSFEDLNDTTESHERRITRCKSCHARDCPLFVEKSQ